MNDLNEFPYLRSWCSGALLVQGGRGMWQLTTFTSRTVMVSKRKATFLESLTTEKKSGSDVHGPVISGI